MANPTWKRWDTYPPLQVVLSDTNGAIALTTATQVKVIMQNTLNTATSVLVTGVMSIASAAGGYCTYNWGTHDLSWADTYNVEFEIAWQAGGIETVPNNVYAAITVVADLENS